MATPQGDAGPREGDVEPGRAADFLNASKSDRGPAAAKLMSGPASATIT
jgi:hypothetical protein